MALIDVIGSEAWWNNNSSSKMDEIEDYCEDLWNNEIDYDGDYTSYFIPNNSPEIPDSAFQGCPDLECRLSGARYWLENNFQYFGSTDAILVLDWSAVSGLGMAYVNGAGTDYKVCIVNCQQYDGGRTDIHENTLESGSSLHEVLHLFSCAHDDGGIFADQDCTTMVGNNIIPECFESGEEPMLRIDNIASCAVGETRDFIDAHL